MQNFRRHNNIDFRKIIALSTSENLIVEPPSFEYIVSVQGFGYSGSGAVLDLLREYEDTHVLGYIDPEACKSKTAKGVSEIEIIRMPGGLYDLENNIEVDNVFINDALLNRTVKLFESSALYKMDDYMKNLFAVFFRKITTLRMTSLSQTYYNGHLSNPYEVLDIYFKRTLSRDIFIETSKQFLISIFNHVNDNSKYMVVDQLFSDTDLNIERNKKYIPNLKMIVVVRDPRDIYAWAILKDIEWIAHNTVDDFIQWYECQYKNSLALRSTTNCLVVDYENLVLQYNYMVEKIESFIGYNRCMHKRINECFDPSFSIKFVGIYKTIGFEKQISIIRNKLKKYCNPLID